MKLSRVALRLPPWRVWERQVEGGLVLEPGEDARTVDLTTQLRLPGVLVLDYDRAAQQVGWTLGQFLSYLVVQGAMRVCERAGQPRRGEA